MTPWAWVVLEVSGAEELCPLRDRKVSKPVAAVDFSSGEVEITR
jgi:hypothetical protein